MGKRDDAKLQTRNNILLKATELFLAKGVQKTSTQEIAKAAGVAHGSIFVHYYSRENLVVEVLYNEIKGIVRELSVFEKEHHQPLQLLDKYIELFNQKEDVFYILYHELDYLHPDIKIEVIPMETMIRNCLYLSLNAQGMLSQWSPEEIGAKMEAFFSLIFYYICMRDVYGKRNEVILKKKERIIDHFKMIFLQSNIMAIGQQN